MTSEKGKNYSFWLSFFRGAGILANFDTKYALVFDENRIKPDMLLDISKECLRDMGISAMGDIIAILRHAKKAHEESKTLAFEKTKVVEAPVSHASHTSSSSTPPKSTQTSKSSEKVTTTTPALASASTNTSSKAPASKAAKPNSTTAAAASKPASKDAPTASSISSTVESKLTSEGHNTAVQQPYKAQKRIIIVNQESSSDSDAALQDEVPSQKKPCVLPQQHEDKYKIKKPDATTQRTQRLLNERLGPSVSDPKSNVTGRKDVFSRLDASGSGGSVSTTAIVRPSTSSEKLTNDKEKHSRSPSSVFQRLGGRGSHSSGSNSESSPSKRSSVIERRESSRDSHRSERSRPHSPPRRPIEYSSPTYDMDIGRRMRLYDKNSARGRGRQFSPPGRRSDESGSSSTRMRSDYNYSGGRNEEVDMRYRLGGGSSRMEETRRTSKIIATSSIKNVGDLKVGQVLKTRRIQRSDGTSVVQRVIVKRLPKAKPKSPQSLPEIDDPLEELFDD